MQTQICRKCGTMLGPSAGALRAEDSFQTNRTKAMCRLCKDGSQIGSVQIPYIFKFLVTQLSSVNINVKLETETV